MEKKTNKQINKQMLTSNKTHFLWLTGAKTEARERAGADSVYDDNSDKNVINLHIQELKTIVLHALLENF